MRAAPDEVKVKVLESRLLFVVPSPWEPRHRLFVVPYYEDKIILKVDGREARYDTRIRRGRPVFLDKFDGTVPESVVTAGFALAGVYKGVGVVLENFCADAESKPEKVRKSRAKKLG